MVGPIEIRDPLDPRVDQFRNVKDVARRVDGTFVAESELVIERLLASRFDVRSLLLAPNRLRRLEGRLRETHADVFVANQAIIDTIVGFALHRGGVAIGERAPLPDIDALLVGARLVVALDDVVDPDNVGSIFRHAAAFGVDGVVLSAGAGDPLYRKSVRTSMGHVLAIPYARLEPPDSIIETANRNGFRTLAFTPDRSATDIRRVDASSFDRLLVLVGSEAAGLSARVLEQADVRVRIPISSNVDSLNVATAVAIALFSLTSHR